MHDLTVSYLDADSSTRGRLYLPGEPVEVPEWESGCAMCGHLLDTLLDRLGQPYTGHLPTGHHAGVVELPESVGSPAAPLPEWLHLRCLLDSVELGAVALTFVPPCPARDDIEGHPSYRPPVVSLVKVPREGCPLTRTASGSVELAGTRPSAAPVTSPHLASALAQYGQRPAPFVPQWWGC